MSFNKIILLLIFLVNAVVFGQSNAIDKVGTTSFQFLKVAPDARATGMGESFVSVADDINSIYWNPAGLAGLSDLNITTSFVDYFMDVVHFSFAGSYNFGEFGTIGISALFTDVGDIPVTNVENLFRDPVTGVYNPGLTGEYINPGATMFSLSYARAISTKFSFGLTVKYAEEDLVVDKKGVVMFDGGILYDTGFKTIKLGISLRHFGPEVKYVNKSYPLPQVLAMGISGYLFSPGENLLGDLGHHKILISYDLTQPRDYSQQHQIGMEYSFLDYLFLRGGYKINYDEEGITFGGGVKYSNYSVDYSYNDYGEYLGGVHRFSIAFSY